MPTYSRSTSFKRDYKGMNAEQKTRFRSALRSFVDDLTAIEDGEAKSFRRSLRVKSMQNHPGVFEMSWDGDGRATFEYGDELRHGKRHVKWRRIGGHDVFDSP